MRGLSLVVVIRGYSPVVVHGLLTAVSSLAGLGCLGFSSCGTRAQLPHGMWNPPGLWIKPTFLALAARFLTTRPRGKSDISKYC